MTAPAPVSAPPRAAQPRVAGRIRTKLSLAFLLVSLLPLAAFAVFLWRSTSRVLLREASERLTAIRALQADRLEQHFLTAARQTSSLAESVELRELLEPLRIAAHAAGEQGALVADDRAATRAYYDGEFTAEYRRRNQGATPAVESQLGGLADWSLRLQRCFLADNAAPFGLKQGLDEAPDAGAYARLHAAAHPLLRRWAERWGVYDLLLCDLESGDVVYSVRKQPDFATSLRTGPYSESSAGRAFRLAATTTGQEAVFVDFEPYLPACGSPVCFYGAPITRDGRRVGVVLVSLGIGDVQAILARTEGLGATGETFAVGPDHRFRSESRFATELGVGPTTLNPALTVDVEATRGATPETVETRVATSYRGRSVLSTWQSVRLAGRADDQAAPRWTLVAEQELSEARGPVAWRNLTPALLGVLGLAGLAVLVATTLLSGGMVRQTESITAMLERIGVGDYEARAAVITRDELGATASALNSMCDNTLTLIQSKDERDRIESSINDLIRDMRGIANGDLTLEARVSGDVTGSIAGSVNYMVQQLRQIIRNVKGATLMVSSSASQIQTATETLSDGSQAQSRQILETTAAVKDMAGSIQQVAASTSQSALVAEEAQRNASKGARAVEDTVRGMERIRSQVQETSKRIKRLGESSQEIGEIIQLISDIADRTSILALNASIQAAMAGDAGQGFAVVAEEVERLAERSTDAAKQVATLVRTIQAETAEAVAGMEESTREVVEGSELASLAGRALSDIDSVSNRLAELIGTISQAVKQQAAGADSISGAMHEIAEATLQTAGGTKQAAVSVSHLAGLADGLRESVSRFKLPSGDDHSPRLKEEKRRQALGAALLPDGPVAVAGATAGV